MGREPVKVRSKRQTTAKIYKSAGVGQLRVNLAHKNAYEKIKNIYAFLEQHGYVHKEQFSIGRVERRMKDFAKTNGVVLARGGLYMSASKLKHARRKSKIKDGKAPSVEDVASFPMKRRKMDLYFDTNKRNFIYTDYRNKFVIEPNYEVGTNKHVNFVTADKVGRRTDFNGRKYIKI